MRRRYRVADFAPHIKGSGGIVSTVAARAGCSWRTADSWLKTTPTLRALFDAESETSLDFAESVILGNIYAAARQQALAKAAGEVVIVDSSDARWLLTRKGRGRGYGESADVNLMAAPDRIQIREIRVHLPERD